jgi:hypothetical protein
MFLVRIDYVSPTPQPTMLAHVASIPSAGDYLLLNDGDASVYVQSATIVVNPKPGQPVAFIRITE